MSLKQKITYQQFAKAKLKWSSLGGDVVSIPKEKSTYKSKPWVCPESLNNYIVERDRVIWKLHPESRKEIEERYSENSNSIFKT